MRHHLWIICKGPSIKDVRTKSRKIDPLVRKMSALAQPPPLPPCSCGHTKNFEKSEVFCSKKCRRPHLKKPPSPPVRKMSALDNPPDWERLLWAAPNLCFKFLKPFKISFWRSFLRRLVVVLLELFRGMKTRRNSSNAPRPVQNKNWKKIKEGIFEESRLT